MAALRVVFVLATLLDRVDESSTLSISEIERRTGLSRPMVIEGVKTAEGFGWIRVDRSSRMYRYAFVTSENKNGKHEFHQVPTRRIEQHLPDLPNRGAAALYCLKLYAYLLSRRNWTTNEAFSSHETIEEKSGIPRNKIRMTIDVLINNELIHVYEKHDRLLKGNRYLLRGFRYGETEGQPDEASNSTDSLSEVPF